MADGILAIVAGSETVSITLTGLWYWLLRYPGAYQRLREEIDTNFAGKEEEIFDTNKLAKMPYLNAVMYVPCDYSHAELIMPEH